MKRAVLFVVVSAFALTACNTSTSENSAQVQKAGTQLGIEPSWMDKSVTPGVGEYTASGSFVTGCSDLTTGTPIEMLGTKCPSITST